MSQKVADIGVRNHDGFVFYERITKTENFESPVGTIYIVEFHGCYNVKLNISVLFCKQIIIPNIPPGRLYEDTLLMGSIKVLWDHLWLCVLLDSGLHFVIVLRVLFFLKK